MLIRFNIGFYAYPGGERSSVSAITEYQDDIGARFVAGTTNHLTVFVRIAEHPEAVTGQTATLLAGHRLGIEAGVLLVPSEHRDLNSVQRGRFSRAVRAQKRSGSLDLNIECFVEVELNEQFTLELLHAMSSSGSSTRA